MNVNDANSVSSSPKESITQRTSAPKEIQILEAKSPGKSETRIESTKQSYIAKGLEGDDNLTKKPKKRAMTQSERGKLYYERYRYKKKLKNVLSVKKCFLLNQTWYV